MSDETCHNLPGKQGRFLEALLTSPIIAAAAKKAGISERTGYRWLREDGEFRSRYREAKGQVIEHCTVLLAAGAHGAVAVLLKVANDAAAPSSARVLAAGKILDITLKVAGLDDLSGRVESLEAALLPPEAVTNGKSPQKAR